VYKDNVYNSYSDRFDSFYVYYMKRRAVSLRQRSFSYLIRLLPPVPEQLCAKPVKRITTTKSTLSGNARRHESVDLCYVDQSYKAISLLPFTCSARPVANNFQY